MVRKANSLYEHPAVFGLGDCHVDGSCAFLSTRVGLKLTLLAPPPTRIRGVRLCCASKANCRARLAEKQRKRAHDQHQARSAKGSLPNSGCRLIPDRQLRPTHRRAEECLPTSVYLRRQQLPACLGTIGAGLERRREIRASFDSSDRARHSVGTAMPVTVPQPHQGAYYEGANGFDFP
jgi:hypothetical protein